MPTRNVAKSVQLPASLAAVVDTFVASHTTFNNLATAALLCFLSDAHTSPGERDLWLRAERLMRKRGVPWREALRAVEEHLRQEDAA